MNPRSWYRNEILEYRSSSGAIPPDVGTMKLLIIVECGAIYNVSFRE